MAASRSDRKLGETRARHQATDQRWLLGVGVDVRSTASGTHTVAGTSWDMLRHLRSGALYYLP